MTWQALTAVAPRLESYVDDARAIARNARWDWYGRWIGGFEKLRGDLKRAAEWAGCDFHQAHRAAVDYLTGEYNRVRHAERFQPRNGSRSKASTQARK